MTLGTGRSAKLLYALLLLPLLFTVPSGAGPRGSDPYDRVPGEFIIRFRPDMSIQQREQALRAAGARPLHHFYLIPATLVHLPDAAARSLIDHLPGVVSVEPNHPMFLETAVAGTPPKKGGGGGGGGGGQIIPASIQRVGTAPGSVPYTGRGVGVAVMDTGIDLDHPDFLRGTSSGVSPICFSAFSTPTAPDTCDDVNGHGTFVAGIIGASNNTIDVVGAAPEVTLYAVKVVNAAGGSSDALWVLGLDWIAQNANSVVPPIRVVNMSLMRYRLTSETSNLHDAVKRVHDMGITIVTIAGNDQRKQVRDIIPAAYPEVMAIASTTTLTGVNPCVSGGGIPADTASTFTTDGAFNPTTGVGVTMSAPGELQEDLINVVGYGCVSVTHVGITSLTMGGGSSNMLDGLPATGTSFSAPLVAGVVALMWEQAGRAGATLFPDVARERIRGGADRIGVAPLDGFYSDYTFDGEREGILSASGALRSGYMKVAGISMACVSAAKGTYKARATIQVTDLDVTLPVISATVLGTWSGAVSEGGQGLTDGAGNATITTIGRKPAPATFTFTVTDITHQTYAYDPASNVVSSGTITCGG